MKSGIFERDVLQMDDEDLSKDGYMYGGQIFVLND